MPRVRRKKRKEKKPSKSDPSQKEAIASFETYGLDRLQSFMRAREDIIAIAYRVPTENLAKDGHVAKYRGELILSIQKLGQSRGQTISTQHIHIDALPLGHETLIKAWALMKNVGGNVKIRDQRPKDPMDWNVQGVQT